MPSTFQFANVRHHQKSQTGDQKLVFFSFLVPLISLALPWDFIEDENLAKLVEKVGVGSATEMEWGFQYIPAYLILVVWLFPILSVLRDNPSAKIGLLLSFLPLLLLVITGSVFGMNYGPSLCLLGALILPCSMAKLHHPRESALSAIGSILAPPRTPTVEEEDEYFMEQTDLKEVEPVPQTGSMGQEAAPQMDHRDSASEPELPQTDSASQEAAIEKEGQPQMDHLEQEEVQLQMDRPELAPEKSDSPSEEEPPSKPEG